jgi:hypothetical protein
VKASADGDYALEFGESTDTPVQSDFTGDGKTDVAFYRPSTGYWYVLRSEDYSYYSFPFGVSTDLPATGDFDSDGKSDAGVYRPSTGTWYVSRSTLGTLSQAYGLSTDKPVPNAFVP